MSVLRLLKSLLADTNARIGELLSDRNTLIECVWASAQLLEERFPELAQSQRELVQQMLDRDDRYLEQLQREAAQGVVTSGGEVH